MPEKIEGSLQTNSTGRFEIDGHEFTSGSSIQIFHPETGYWLVGRVEYAKTLGGYYFYSDYPDIPSFPLREEMKARVGYKIDHVSPWMIRALIDSIGNDLVEAMREKASYPTEYKEEIKKACKRLEEFLSETDGVPCLNA